MIRDEFDRVPANRFIRGGKSRKRWHPKKRRAKPSVAESYREYLNSDHWKKFTRQILLERGRMCERCGKSDRVITVHHLSYVRLGNELPEDVKVYCWPCHQLMHPDKRGSG